MFKLLHQKNKKLKIVAVIHTLYTNTFDTLYYEVLKRNDIDFKFVLIPFKQGDFEVSISEIKKMMDEKKYPYIIGYDEFKNEYLDLKIMKPDIVFLQTPYDIQRKSELYFAKYLSTFADVYHISYGSTMLDYDQGRYKGLITGFLRNFKGVFSESTYLANYLDKYNPGKYIPVGYMKCDKYLHYTKEMPVTKKKEYDFTIAWKPRWVGDIKGSNLLKYLEFFTNLCDEYSNFQLIFIKHQLCEQQLIKNKILTEEEVKTLFGNLYRTKNIKVVEDGDFLDDVFNADVFVGDYCSTIMEFALSKKPVIYTPVDDIVLSEYGKKILTSWYEVKSAEDLKECLLNLKNGNDLKRAIREKENYLLSDSPKLDSIALDILDYLIKNTNCNYGYRVYENEKHKIYNILGIKIKIKRSLNKI